MVYNLSFGRQFVLQMDYHQRETRPNGIGVVNFGPNWNCNLLTYVQVDGSVSYDWQTEEEYDYVNGVWVTNVVNVVSGGFQATEFCPDGGQQTYTWGGNNYDNTMNPRTHTRMIPTTARHDTTQVNFFGQTYTNSVESFVTNTLVYANGSVAFFDLVVNGNPPQKIALQTTVTDPNGHTMRYNYMTNGGQILLTQVVDFDGNTNQFVYGNASFPTSVTQVTNTVNHLVVNFRYDTNGFMTNIVDVAGISSSFQYTNASDLYYVTAYDTNGIAYPLPIATNSVWLLASLKTPYGATTFDYVHPTWPSFTGNGTNSFIDRFFNGINYAITVTQPDGGKHLFLYRDNGSYPALNSPYQSSVANDDYAANFDKFNYQATYGELSHDNSFYWGPRQYAALSTTVLTNLDYYDFSAARVRVWMQDYSPEGGYLFPSQLLFLEQGFTPDLVNGVYAVATWYGYEGRINAPGYSDMASTNDWLPCSIGYRFSAGSGSHLENIERNSLGYPTKRIEFGSDDNYQPFVKTNQYIYAANGIDMIKHIGPDGVVEAAYGYDGYHHVLFMTNALNEVTRYTYNANGQVTSIVQPNGQTTTNTYNAGGFLSQQIVACFSTNSYTYTNGLVLTHTDERGLTTTNTWDALQRLTKVSYPDVTFVSYLYSNLDLVRVVDRLGYTTGYAYDNMQRRTAVTNALLNVTSYGYCTCGSLESIRDAAGNFTYFYYDQAGRLTNTVYADGYAVSRAYNWIGKVINTADSSGNSVNNYYDAELRLVGVTNLVGGLAAYAYDVDGLVTNSVDANGVSVGMTYDNLHRLLTRTYPDGGVEKYGYAANIAGPTSYTNQIGNVVLYTYDTLNRKTKEVYVGVTTNQFAYNGAGDLLTLTDGKNQNTAWGYDVFGRVTNKVDNLSNLLFVYKYDPNNRLTNRWSAAKGGTVYTYDAVGNLTHVTYPVSPAISLGYDALNRLNSMVDAVGTTVYGYDAAGQLLSEDGPWASDTVSYTYQHRLRTGMSVAAPNGSAWAQGYQYDAMRRLLSVTSPAGTFGYNYGWDEVHGAYWQNWQAGDWEYEYESYPGTRVFALTLPGGAYITNRFDGNARLLSTALMSREVGWVWDSNIPDWVFIGSSNLDAYAYGYNLANQRTNVVRTAGDYVNYTYDNMGQLKAAIGKEAGGVTNRWQEQFGYAYDAAGNLNFRTNNALVQTFNVNSLNELTTTTNAGRLTVAGTTTSPATNVTVNTSNAVIYADVTFASTNQPWVNGNNTFTAIAKDAYGRRDTNSITVLQATNVYAYDLNGNLLYDGRRAFAYDDENQLIRVTVTNGWKSEYTYDGKMRRRIVKEFTWNGSWVQTNEVHYIYDGNLVVQERDANNLPQVTYTRGTDLSGSMQGAGGIGGLLARTDNNLLNAGSAFANAFYHADGNGNVTCLIYTNQMIAAKYLYDPYGNMLSMYGSLADANSYRFSSKEWNQNSGLYYYLYRLYDANLQRWVNKDPLGETGFGVTRHTFALFLAGEPNRYQFVDNKPTGKIDPLGLKPAVKVPEFPDLDKDCANDPDVALSYKKLIKCQSDSGDGTAECVTICDCIAQGSNIAKNFCIGQCDKAWDAHCLSPTCPVPPPPTKPTKPQK